MPKLVGQEELTNVFTQLQKYIKERIDYLEAKNITDTTLRNKIYEFECNDEIVILQKAIIDIDNISYIENCPEREKIIVGIGKLQCANNKRIKELLLERETLWRAHPKRSATSYEEQSEELRECIYELYDISYEVKVRDRITSSLRCLQNGFPGFVLRYITFPYFQDPY